MNCPMHSRLLHCGKCQASEQRRHAHGLLLRANMLGEASALQSRTIPPFFFQTSLSEQLYDFSGNRNLAWSSM